MSEGALTASLREGMRSIEQLSEGTVQSAEIVQQHIEVEVQLVPRDQTVWVELLQGLGGTQGGAVRVPSQGDSVLVGLVEGDPNEGFMLGWLADSSTPLPSDVEGGATYMWAPNDEPLKILTADGTPAVTLKPDGTVIVEADSIQLGSEAPGDKMALASKVKTELDEIRNQLMTHTHSAPSGATGPPQPGSPSPADSVASDTVESE